MAYGPESNFRFAHPPEPIAAVTRGVMPPRGSGVPPGSRVAIGAAALLMIVAPALRDDHRQHLHQTQLHHRRQRAQNSRTLAGGSSRRATSTHRCCHVSNDQVFGFEFRIWSGARDLNPGPHGPEPAVCRVLPCPAGSFRVLLCSISPADVSFCFLLCPPGSANA
jgi:hypothetical protein